jgi:hypothetical protein
MTELVKASYMEQSLSWYADSRSASQKTVRSFEAQISITVFIKDRRRSVTWVISRFQKLFHEDLLHYPSIYT